MLPYVTFVYILLVAVCQGDGVSAQKTVGDWCTLKNGDTGVCTVISQCTPAVMLGHLGMRPIICSFQSRTPIVCCGESLNTQLYYATSSTTPRPRRKPSSLGNSNQNSRAPQQYPNENNNNNQQYPNSRPSSNNNQQYPNNRPSSNNNQQYPNRPSSNNNQEYPNRPSSNNNQEYPNSRPSSNNNQQYPNNRPSSNNNQQYPNNRPSSNINNGYPNENTRPLAENPSGNRPFRPGSSSYTTEKPTLLFPVRPGGDRESESPPRRPSTPSSNRGRVSEIKCGEYSKLVTDVVEAIPLIPNAESVALEVQKCDLAGLQLIVGGNKTEPGEFPHMAAIGFENSRGDLEWKCGGSLISDLYVLTAAHCTYTGLGPPVVVRLGEYNLKSNYDGANPIDFRVADIIRHPDYKPPARYNDIALLKLNKPVRFSKYIRPACLYTQPRVDKKKAVATGWGNIDYAEGPSDTLLKVPLSIVDNNLCNDLYQSDSRSNHLSRGIVSSMLCAGELSGGKDTCQGDSGGPLQVTQRNNQCVYYIVGVTSFGKYCAAKNAPGVYTRVSHFVPWVESVVWS